jgi:carboxymethylenebutenolidase
MDGLGMRPALVEMAQRIASHGYVVVLPDLFYRTGPYEAPDAKSFFVDPELRQAWVAKHLSAVTIANVREDTRALLAFLDEQPFVAGPAIGATGYCLGGRLSLAMAGTFPDRIAAAASYHGSGLATDAPDSPHLLAPAITGRVYVGGAVDDASFTDAIKARLEEALSAAGVDHLIETYEGARHGWVPTDTPTHDARAAERHWQTLFALLDGKLMNRTAAASNPSK